VSRWPSKPHEVVFTNRDSMDFNQVIEICKDTERRESKLKTITKDVIADILAKSSPSTGAHDTRDSDEDIRDHIKEIRD
jgi:hypothetical protein